MTLMSKLRIGILLAAVLTSVAAGFWWLTDGYKRAQQLVLYGNVDLRQADLPFNASERVIEVLVQEGAHVKRGQLLARLDPTRIQPQVDKAQADVAGEQQVVNRMHAGNRPEEIAQARANVLSARANTTG
jgi:HlyD family secretion protein